MITETIFADDLEQYGARPAIVLEDGRTYSYAQLAEAADAFASQLPEGRPLLAIEAANAFEALSAYLGALRRRVPVVLLGGEEGQNQGVLATYPFNVRYRKQAGAWMLETLSAAQPAMHRDLCLMLSTSGTTGAAKLVRLAYSAVDANARSIGEYLDIAQDDKAILTLPIHYSYGLSVVNSHLARGATIVVTDSSVIDDAFWTLVDQHRPTSLAGVPYTYELLERVGIFEKAPPPSLRTMTAAGGRLPPKTAQRIGRWAADHGLRFFVMYGQTEATARMAYVPPETLLEHPSSIGQAIPRGAFRLVGDQGETIEGADAVGELAYSGPNVMMGYAQCAEDLALEAELTELLTGDLAKRDAKGFYYIVGRKSRFSKLYGLRLSWDEIEAGLSSKGLRAAAIGDDTFIAIAVEGQADLTTLAEDLAAQYKIPVAAFQVDATDHLPVLSSGKTDYQAVLRRAKTQREQAPKTEGILSLFAHAFPGRPLSREDSFTSLGGDSLNYVTLSLDLENQLGQLPTRWENLSIGELERSRAKPPARQGMWTWRPIDSEIVLRAVAILAVVVTHASSLVVGGGAEALLLLAGYNLARYQRGRLVDGGGLSAVWAFMRRVIAPYYVLLLIYALWKRDFDLPSLLLVSNFFGRFESFLEPYWFLEALLQCTIIIALLIAIPPVKRLAQKDFWSVSVAFLGATLFLKVAAFMVFHHSALIMRTPDAVLYLMALGACLQQAATRPRQIMLTCVAVLVAVLDLGVAASTWQTYNYPSNITHAVWILATSFAILWLPRLYLPQVVRTVVATIAASSFYIYLTHGVPVHVITRTMEMHNVGLALALSVVTGVFIWQLMERLPQLPARRGKPVAKIG